MIQGDTGGYLEILGDTEEFQGILEDSRR